MTGSETPGAQAAGRTVGALVVRALTKSYAELRAVDGVSLDVRPGEFVTFLGPSGSGKTTTLKMIAGFTEPDAGDIQVDGRSLVGVPPHRRDIGMVFQNYALFPHMTAAQNVAFPLEMKRLPKAEVRRRTGEVLALVRLGTLGHRYPRQLSGGQQQRIALARAIVFQPRVLLMDEPLGALDKKLREALQLEIMHISRQVGVTVVYVTHDQEEALVMSDRIAIFNQGRIEQLGTGEDLYDRPASLFVADFIGESNIFRGRLEAGGETAWVGREPFRWRVPADAPGRVGLRPGAAAAVVVRPERLLVAPADGSAGAAPALSNASPAVLKEMIYLGSTRKYVLALADGTAAIVRRQADQAGPDLRPGQEVVVGWRVEDGVVVADEAAEQIEREESGDVVPPPVPGEPPASATVAASEVPGLSHRE